MSFLRASLLSAAAALSSLAAQAATVIPVATDGQWHAFTVDAGSAASGGLEWIDSDYDFGGGAGDFQPLSFTFTVSDHAILRVVDGLFVGDTFRVAVNSAAGTQLYDTSSVPAQLLDDSYSLTNHGTDFDAAFADTLRTSRLELVLGAGTYTVSGSLLQSVSHVDFGALNSTNGALSVTAVPEPASYALLLAAVGVVGLVSRRRNQA